MTITEYGCGIWIFLTFLSPFLVYLCVYYLIYKYKSKINCEAEKEKSQDSPLAVLNYVWWKLAWTSFCPYTIFWFLFFYGSHGYSDSSDVNLLIKIGIFMILIVATFFFVEQLMTKDIVLYCNRIEKNYFALFPKRQIIISSAIYSTTNSFFNFLLAIWDKKQTKITAYFWGLDIDLSLCTKNDVAVFVSNLAKLTGRTIEEITESSWKPTSLLREDKEHV